MVNIPPLPEADRLLTEAAALNPGPWAEHSRYVALGAQAIAAACPGMDADTAYILGLLHDIGRREGVYGMRHVVDGYRYLRSLGYEDAARICLTHSYPIQRADSGSSAWDGTVEEYAFVDDYLKGIEYTRYDRLIQLCDSLALPDGFCLIEKRLVDVVTRYGFVPLTVQKWQAFFAIRHEFDRLLGKSIYTVLPGVVENTFGFIYP
jgi:hypothetical protein